MDISRSANVAETVVATAGRLPANFIGLARAAHAARRPLHVVVGLASIPVAGELSLTALEAHARALVSSTVNSALRSAGIDIDWSLDVTTDTDVAPSVPTA